MTDIKPIIKKYKSKIDTRLRIFLKNRINKTKDISPFIKELMENMLEYNLRGGKRIRPILVIFSYIAHGGKNQKAIIDAALAVELMESYLLIHDDIMDQDDLRRGYLTMHKIYENVGNRKFMNKDAKRFGENMAIIAGDILAIMGSEAILNSDFPVKNKLKAVEKFNKAVINTCFGQALDIRSNIDPNITEDDIKKIHKLKTAIYTFEAPLHIGAILANAKETSLKQLSEFSIPLGQAFQIQDDILGLFGTKEKIGKPIGSDIKEGRKTLLILHTLKNANKVDREIILRSLGNQKLTINDLKKIREIVIKTKSLEYSKNLVLDLLKKTKINLNKIKLKEEGKDFLFGLIDYLENREY